MFTVLGVIILAGLAVWAVESLVPMDATFKKIFRVVAIVLIVLYVLNFFNLIPVDLFQAHYHRHLG